MAGGGWGGDRRGAADWHACPSLFFLLGQRRQAGARPVRHRQSAGDGGWVRNRAREGAASFAAGARAADAAHFLTTLHSLLWKQQLVGADPSTLLIVASPFERTVETATLAGAAVGVAPGDDRFSTEPDLRERDFGEYELKSHDLYEQVWAGDAQSTAWAAPGGGESVADVSRRAAAVFARLETRHKGRNILLVAHGDTLSIATATALGAGLGDHRSFAQETGELRRLVA